MSKKKKRKKVIVSRGFIHMLKRNSDKMNKI